ncbi:hypothetical protein Adt_39481 [Abeliophyllum distichum]|uniref:Uncharacterized protein n=1 Tax=Abeliophyllum distichum TaxID=126358 RepID=A0ABD1Q577_9LAMI
MENGKRHLTIVFDMVERTLQSLGDNAKIMTRLLGNQIRCIVPTYYPSWIKIIGSANQLAVDQYRDYKRMVHKHYKQDSLNCPYNGAGTGGTNTAASFSVTSVDKRGIVRDVLGERRGHIQEFGHISKGALLSDQVSTSPIEFQIPGKAPPMILLEDDDDEQPDEEEEDLADP